MLCLRRLVLNAYSPTGGVAGLPDPGMKGSEEYEGLADEVPLAGPLGESADAW